MNRYRKLSLSVLAVGLVINLLIGYSVYSRETREENDAEALRRLGVMMRVMMLIRQNYVDPEAIDYQTLIYHALRGMVSQLDPHSSFLEPEEYQQMRETTEGRFGGIGIVVTMREQVLTVVSPIEDTPGSRAGLQAGDQIIAINQQSTKDMPLRDAVALMKGEPGTEVELTINRPDSDEVLEMEIVRDIIEVSSVKDERMLDDSIGYLRITQFDETTSARLGDAIKSLSDQGVQGLIVDLRNNPGGLLTAAVQVSSRFLPAGTTVVHTEGRDPDQQRSYNSRRLRPHFEKPLVILINQGSASASEIVAGSLQDNQRAVLVGTKTFGKGSVQSLISLPDGSALRLTTANYYTPGRRVIHEQGIEPDYEVELSQEQRQRLAEARRQAAEEGEFIDIDADPQLKFAFGILHGEEPAKTAASDEP